MNKKANLISDGAAFLLIIFIFAVVIVVGKFVYDMVNTDIQADQDIPQIAKDQSTDLNSRYTTTFDSAFIVIFFLIWALLIISTFTINTHPFFFAFMIVIFLFMFSLAPIFSNTYTDISTDAEFGTTAQSFTLTNFIMTHLFQTFLVVMSTVLIALYMRGSS